MTTKPGPEVSNPLQVFLGMIRELRSSTEYFYEYKLLIVTQMLHGFAFYILLLNPEFIQEASPSENIGNFLVGVNFALYYTVSILLVLGLSTSSDRKKRRKEMLLILVLAGAGIGFVQTLVTFLSWGTLYIILFTLFMCSIYGAEILIVVLVTEYFEERMKAVAVGFMTSVAVIGLAAGALLSGYLYENIGMEICFFLSAMAMFLSFFVLARVRDVGEEADVRDMRDVVDEGIVLLHDLVLDARKWLNRLMQMNLEKLDSYLFGFEKRRQISLIFSTILMVSIGSGMINPFIVNFLEDRGVSETVIGFVYAIFGMIIFLPVNRLAAGWLSERYTARKVFSVAVLAYIPLWGVFNLSILATGNNTVILAIYAFPVWPFLYIGYQLFVTDFTSRTERARGLSSVRFAMGSGYVIGAIIGAVLLLFDMSHETVFQLAMIFILVAAFMASRILKSSIFALPER